MSNQETLCSIINSLQYYHSIWGRFDPRQSPKCKCHHFQVHKDYQVKYTTLYYRQVSGREELVIWGKFIPVCKNRRFNQDAFKDPLLSKV